MLDKAFLYPLYGIAYFLISPRLWFRCLSGLLFSLILSILSLVAFMPLIAPVANAIIAAGCPAWLAWIVSVISMLICSAIAFLIAFAIFLPILVEKLFLDTLKLKGHSNTIMKHYAPGMDGKIFVASILYGLLQITVLLLTAPLNAIPILGTIAFCYFNGIMLAWGLRLPELFLFRGMGFNQTKNYVKGNISQFSSFGTVAMALELIPFFNWLFMFTNSVGAALWAIDQYKRDIRNATYYTYWKNPPPYLTI